MEEKVGWEVYLDTRTACHTLYSQLALFGFPKGTPKRLMFQEGELDLTRWGGRGILIPQAGES
jgi:hypothetical protein